jgi:Tol biopolymer transport system component
MTRARAITGVCLGVVAIVLVAVAGWSPAAKVRAATPAQESWTELAVHNFGGPINSKWDEGELSFADDGTMVFTSSRQDLAIRPGDPRDLYTATFNKDMGTWNTPVNMGPVVNAGPATDVDPLRKGDDREPWISPDGNTLYFKSDRLATTKPLNINDIFVTHKVNGQWTKPELVPAPISTDSGNEHCPMLLRDGKTLCFASARPGGYGSYDIWCSEQRADGSWEEPVNQGPNINTAGSEFHFMEDKDAKWVYFTSTRAGGHGGADIYAARSLGPNQWGPAVNLGPLVNTAGADMCPALGPDGKTFCWFSPARTNDTLGMADIYWTDQRNIDRVLAAAK